MFIGIGTDIVEIKQIKYSIEKSERFVERVFTRNEITYCEKMINKFQHYAARFAAKEAVLKALKTGWGNGIKVNEIEVKNMNCGAPKIVTFGETKLCLRKMGIKHIDVSLSHCERYAIAIVCAQ